MKFNKILVFVLSFMLLVGLNSCTLHLRSNGSKKGKPGWHKNRNNPHNANTTNPGRGHAQRGTPGKSKGKSRQKK